MMTDAELRDAVAALADAVELELRGLGRWSAEPPPPEAFENMGAFGGGTMAFEQWIQFVLLPRIREIVRTHGRFPSGSEVGVYAVRALDGDYDADGLCSLLSRLDWIIERRSEPPERAPAPPPEPPASDADTDTVRLGGTRLPKVVYKLIELLPRPHYEGQSLDDQLGQFDGNLEILSPVVRPELSALLMKAAAATDDPVRRARIERAARDVAAGGRAGGD